jgi:hypothetical protein
MKLETLDGRHALSSFFSHRARMMGTSEIVLFIQIRNWCWENYGPGIDRDTYWALQYHDITDQLLGFEPQWAWHSEDSKRYIYLKEEVLTMFSLKWLNT